MTFWDILAAVPRRWYVVVAGIACTALALFGVQHRPTVYYSRATVFLVAPVTKESPNALQPTLDSLVITAGIVAKTINGTERPMKLASMDATLVGRGVWDGAMIQLPDNGGQWSADYNTQTLDVQVAAPTPELVRERQAELFAEIDKVLVQLQDEQGVKPADRITTEHAPAAPQISTMHGEGRRAQVMTLALGGGLTVASVYGAEVLAERRRRRAVANA